MFAKKANFLLPSMLYISVKTRLLYRMLTDRNFNNFMYYMLMLQKYAPHFFFITRELVVAILDTTSELM